MNKKFLIGGALVVIALLMFNRKSSAAPSPVRESIDLDALAREFGLPLNYLSKVWNYYLTYGGGVNKKNYSYGAYLDGYGKPDTKTTQELFEKSFETVLGQATNLAAYLAWCYRAASKYADREIVALAYYRFGIGNVQNGKTSKETYYAFAKEVGIL